MKFHLVQKFDPWLDVPDIESTHDTLADAIESVTETVRYWEGMLQEELAGVSHITLNTANYPDDFMVFYMTLHGDGKPSDLYPNGYPTQTDIFTITTTAERA